MSDLTPAEQAAADAIVEYWTPLDGEPDLTIEDVADEARAIVAAVRPHIAAETLRSEADRIEAALAAGAEPTVFVIPAHLWLRDRSETTEETTR